MLLDYLEKETIDDVFYYQYTYDNNGNMMKKEKKYIDTNYVSISTSYTYDTIIPNRLLEEKIEECDVLVPGIGGILGPKITIKTLTYDELSLYPNKIGSKTLLWDLNKLKQVTDTSSIVKYKYNYKGQRIKKEVSETITEYYYDNDLLIAEETNGNYIIKYSYDGWGKLKEKEILTSYYASNNNPFIYKGYYYDVETGFCYCNSRYYSPELCRFIQPADVLSLNPHSINGINIYSYESNNPIGRAKSSSITNVGTLSGFSATMMTPTLKTPNVNSKIANGNYWNLHWENKWFDTDWPGLFVLSQEGFEVVNWSLSIYKGSFYFDNNENHSLYVSAGNIGVYAGLNYKEGIGIDASASVLEIGYDGRIIDASIEGLTIGITYMYKDGKFEFGYGAGWFGWSVSVDFVELIKLLFGGK